MDGYMHVWVLHDKRERKKNKNNQEEKKKRKKKKQSMDGWMFDGKEIYREREGGMQCM